VVTSIPLVKCVLDQFFNKAKSSIFKLNQLILSTMDRIVNYLDESLPAMKSSEFLKFITEVKRLVDVAADMKEERKEDSNCDWLFKQMDARLIDLRTEFDLI
jgi:hypothetical protein